MKNLNIKNIYKVNNEKIKLGVEMIQFAIKYIKANKLEIKVILQTVNESYLRWLETQNKNN